MYTNFLPGVTIRSYSRTCTQNSSIKNLSLSVQTYGEFYCDEQYSTERTGLPQHLLIYTLEGEGILKYHGKQYSLTPETLMIIDCNDYQYYATEGDFWHFYYIHFTGSSAQELTTLFSRNECYCTRIIDGTKFKEKISRIIKSRERTLPNQILEASLILGELFLQAINEQSQETEYKKAYPTIQSAIDFIANHYAEKLNLEKLAKLTFLSKYHFLRLFFRITGMTPMEYLQSFRISQAQILLKTTDLTVEEISARTGYENTAAFIRAFKKQTGTTPGKYKVL